MVTKKEEQSDKRWANYLVLGLLLVIAVVFSFMKLSNVGYVVFSPDSNSNGTSNWVMLQRDLGHSGWDGVSFSNLVGLNQNQISLLTSSSPIVSNGYVFVSNSNATYKLSASNISAEALNLTFNGSSPSTSAVIVDGVLYIGAGNVLYKINASNLSDVLDSYNAGVPVVVSPVVSGGFVYLADGSLVQLNSSNMSEAVSSYSSSALNESSPALASGFIYVSGSDGNLYQLNASNVSQEVSVYAGSGSMSSPAILNGSVFVSDAAGNVYQLNASNVSQEVSVYAGSGSASSPAVSGVYVYVTIGNNVYQLNASNVSQEVSVYAGSGSMSSVAVANGFAYASSDGAFYQLNASNVSDEISSFAANGSFMAPAVTDVYVFVGSSDGAFYQLDALNLTKVSDFTVPVVSITSIGNGDRYSDASEADTLAYSVSDNALESCWYSLDGGSTNSTHNSTCESFTGLSASTGNNTWTVYAEDTSGNIGSDTVSFEIITPTNTTTQTTTTQSQNNTVEQLTAQIMNVPTVKRLTDLAAGVPLTLSVDAASDLGLSNVVMTPSINITQGSVVILKIDTLSVSTLKLSAGKVYQSFQVNSTGGINDTTVNNVSLNFAVSASWFQAVGTDPASVVLYRNADNSLGSWTALNTTLDRYDNTTYYFTAVSPGFSTYAVYANSSSCTAGETRCFAGNVVQACLSDNVWTDNQTCNFSCGDGACLSEKTNSSLSTVLYYVLGAVLVLIIAFLILLGTERGFFKTSVMRVKKMFGKVE